MGSIAFVGWNTFQAMHWLPLMKKIPESVFVLDKRAKGINDFDERILIDNGIPFIVKDQFQVYTIDGFFDAIMCQTIFSKIDLIEKTPIGMLQYGYAKEPHNYGVWRALADVNLVYGDYAAKRIKNYSNVVVTGNPRYSFIDDSQNISLLGEDGRKSVLYAPTWGDLSSIDDYLESVIQLSENYNVILKLHHNTYVLEKDRLSRLLGSNNRKYVSLLGVEVDLVDIIQKVDIVISDYSGAIFDAFYFKKPIVLADLGRTILQSKKINENSIEFSKRGQLGIICDRPENLEESIIRALEKGSFNKDLHSSLFFESNNIDTAVKSIYQLAEGKFSVRQEHLNIREIVKQEMFLRRQVRIMEKKK